MKQQEFEAWKDTRNKGVYRFCLENGVLAWGLPMLIMMSFVNQPFEQGFMSDAALKHYGIWLLGGVFYGGALWFVTERRYGKELARHGARLEPKTSLAE